MDDYFQTLDTLANTVIRDNATTVDENGEFPQAAVDALSESGLMGLISSADVGGLGLGFDAATRVIERIATECGTTAMVACMHYSGTAVIEKFGPENVRRDIAAGKHLSTLAFSEKGSRSQFWAPVGTAEAKNGSIALNAQKSWVTSAHHATAYVWSSRPVAAEGVNVTQSYRSLKRLMRGA